MAALTLYGRPANTRHAEPSSSAADTDDASMGRGSPQTHEIVDGPSPRAAETEAEAEAEAEGEAEAEDEAMSELSSVPCMVCYGEALSHAQTAARISQNGVDFPKRHIYGLHAGPLTCCAPTGASNAEFQICMACLTTYVKLKVEEGETQIPCPNPRCSGEGGAGETTNDETTGGGAGVTTAVAGVYRGTAPPRRRASLSDESVKNILLPNGCPAHLFLKHRLLLEKYTERKAELATRKVEQQRRNAYGPFASVRYAREDMQLRAWASGGKSRRCGSCGAWIEKNQGCNHMTCKQCKHEFWWCCGQKWPGPHNKAICVFVGLGTSEHWAWGPILPVRAVTKTAAGAVAVSAAVAVVAVGVAAAAVVAVPVVPVGCGVLAAKRMRLCGEERRADETLARLEAKRVAEYDTYLATKAALQPKAPGSNA